MDAVTRKSGTVEEDIDAQYSGSNLPQWQQWLCREFPGVFGFCSGEGGTGSSTQQGSGSFNT